MFSYHQSCIRGGAARRYALDLQWKLSTLFETIEVKFTTGEGDATRFAKDACERGFDAVFCMGGDGTVNETVNGIAQGDSNLPLALSLLELLTICLAHLGFTKIQLRRSNASTSMKQEQLILVAAMTNISATTSQQACIPKVVEEVTPKEKAYSALSPTSCAQVKRYLQLKTIHTASKQRTTTLSVNPLSF